MYLSQYTMIDPMTISFKLKKDKEVIRNFKIKIVDSYIVEPTNKLKLKHRGRKCTITGIEYDDLKNAKKLRVKFHDTGKMGKVDMDDLNVYV